MIVYVVRTDSKNKGKFRVVKLDLNKNKTLKKASTILRNLSKEEANKVKHILTKG